MEDLFKSGAHYPNDLVLPTMCNACAKQQKPSDGRGHAACRAGAEVAHRTFFKDRDKPLINRGKSFEQLLSLFALVGLQEREKVVKTQRIVRSKSPTLRKTETQDIYRTFIDYPEG